MATIINQATELEKLSPFEQQARDYAIQIEAITITDQESHQQASKLKKEVTSFITNAEKTRKVITAPIDELKSALIARANEVLAPAQTAKSDITNKIIAYEAELERKRQAEIDRVNAIIAIFALGKVKDTIEANQEMKAKVAKHYNGLSQEDQDNPTIKEACQALLERINQQVLFLIEEEARAKEAERLAKLAQELDAEKAKIELEKIEQEKKQRELEAEQRKLKDQLIRQEIEKEKLEAQKQANFEASLAPKSGLRVYTKFEIEDPNLVPKEFCSPDDKLINQAIKNGVTEIAGIKIYQIKK